MAAAVTQAVRVGFGVVALGLDLLVRSLEPDRPGGGRQGPRLPVADLADLAVGTAWGAARLSGRVASTGSRLASPVVALVVRPPGSRHACSPVTAWACSRSGGAGTARERCSTSSAW